MIFDLEHVDYDCELGQIYLQEASNGFEIGLEKASERSWSGDGRGFCQTRSEYGILVA